MPNAIFENLLRGLLRDTPSGVWQQEYLCLPARTDTRVPHIHGRVPDVIELGDLPVPIIQRNLQIEQKCQSYSWWFNPAAPAGQTVMEVVDIPEGIQRPLGAPLVQVIVVSSSHVVVRNWHELDHRSVTLLTMSRVAPMQFEDDDMAKLGVRCDFFGTPASGASALNVDFTDTTTYAVPEYVPDSWAWDFGDGNYSTDQNPSHQFVSATPTTFTVTLTVTFTNGKTCTVRKPAYIEII